jgi:hypothetical protein
MAELVDALDSKSGYRKVVQVRFLFWALGFQLIMKGRNYAAFFICKQFAYKFPARVRKSFNESKLIHSLRDLISLNKILSPLTYKLVNKRG